MNAGVAAAVREVLLHAFAFRSDEAREGAARTLALTTADDEVAALVAATVLADYIDARFTQAVVSARRARDLAAGASAPVRLIVASAYALAVANEPSERGASHGEDFDTAYDLIDAAEQLEPALAWLTLALLGEAAFAQGQIAASAWIVARRDELETPSEMTWLAFLQPVRVALFGGDLATARSRCEATLAPMTPPPSPLALGLSHAFLALIAAYQHEDAVVDREVQAVADLVQAPQRWADSGAYVVCAFALATADRPGEARPWVLAGGGGSDLHLVQVVDRALCFDILVAAAIAEGAVEEAVAWAARAHELDSIPSAGTALEQIDARLALAAGDLDEGGQRAAAASARARAAGRVLEATAADLALARAMIAAGDIGRAVGQLNDTAHHARLEGAVVLRRRAVAELRRLGRRVAPPRGSGTTALSARELEVARMAAEGFSSRTIAQALFLSERTVQVHLHRAMQALGVSSRAGLPQALGEVRASDDALPMPLTNRQAEVARHIRAGLSNAEIAAAMGISVKTVEKHVATIFGRWGVSSRTGIARMAASAAPLIQVSSAVADTHFPY